MSSNGEESLPLPALTTWQESIVDLSSRLSRSAKLASSPCNKATTAIEHACADLLAADGGGHCAAGAVPSTVRGIVATIYLRALIRSGRYGAVVEYCRRHDGDGAHGLEEAYALYRLRRYEMCRRRCATAIGKGDDGGVCGDRGLQHVHAQALYRMGETGAADAAYHALLVSSEDVDDIELEDTLSNALANRAANYTLGSLCLSVGNGVDTDWLEVDGVLASVDADADADAEQDGTRPPLENYDLAYNLATYLLVSADARDRSHAMRARRLLERAEAAALSSGDDADNENNDENSDDTAAAVAWEVARRKRRLQAERDAGPIRANLALAWLRLGGDANVAAALRAYTTLAATATKAKQDSAMHANLAAAASNNVALLLDGEESAFAVLKRVPVPSEDGSAGVGPRAGGRRGKGGEEAAVPLTGATLTQTRTALFNRALLCAKMGHTAGAAAALDTLRVALQVAYRGDDGATEQNGAAEQENGEKGTRGKRSKGKKKHGAGAAPPRSGVGNGNSVPTGRPASRAETTAWEARADWLESERRRASAPATGKGGSAENALDDALAKLATASGARKDRPTPSDGTYDVLAFTEAQLLLHRAAAREGDSCLSLANAALESLPRTVQSRPGAVVARASLLALTDPTAAEALLRSLGNSAPARLALAEFYMGRGQHGAAVALLRGAVAAEAGALGCRREATALLVEALSYAEPAAAEEHVGALQEALGMKKGNAPSALEGEALEAMDIPRFAKKAVCGGAASGAGGARCSSSKVRTLIAGTGTKRGPNPGERKKKNHESILRKRSRRKEAYLSRLAAEGRYDPNRTPVPRPDPERWIPKSQRSYNRRGRNRGGGRYGRASAGAQGGGAGVGMEKDAARFDVAARVAARAAAVHAGGDGVGGKPSTANMKVSSSGVARKGKGKGKGGRRR